MWSIVVSATTHGGHRHRLDIDWLRVPLGSSAAAGTQVSANKASTARFKQLMDCLAEGSELSATMIPPASYSRVKCAPEHFSAKQRS